MLSTELVKRAQEDIDFKTMNIEKLQDQIIEFDNQKTLYDEGIVKIETELLNRLDDVNKSFDAVSQAYDAAIASDCKSDLFWRVIDFTVGTDDDEFTLECTRLNPGGYSLTTNNIDSNAGIGSTVAYVGVTGIVTYYPASQTYGNESEEIDDFVNNPYFGFDRRNRYGLKIYSEPFDKDIGNTLIGEFIGTCSIGSTEVTVMQSVGAGLTFGVGQIIISAGKPTIFPNNAKIVGVGTITKDIRSIPSTGIGSTAVTVNILSMDQVCGDNASAPESDGSFVEFRAIDDPVAFRFGGRKRYDIPFNQDPFTPQTISIANTSTLGTGISVYIENSGVNVKFASWDSALKFLPLEHGGQVEPEVGAGQAFYRVGFGHAPVDGGTRASEGDIITVQAPLSDNTIYTALTPCSTQIDDAITNSLGISSTKETALISQGSENFLLAEGVQALRRERNRIQLGIHGTRKILGQLNEEMDELESLQIIINNNTVSNIVK